MWTKRLRNLVLAASAVVAAALGTGVWAVPVLAGEPLKIGASISTTGTYSKPGKYTQEGYLLWEKQVNERGCSSAAP